MMSTLLREIVHAYEHVRAAPPGPAGCDSHDDHFCSRISVMHERAKRLLDVDAIEIGENCRQYHRLEDSDSSRRDGRERS